METITRHHAGRPDGGQFSVRDRDEACVTLAKTEVFSAVSAEPKRGQWTIFDPTVIDTSSIDSYAITSHQAGGQPHLSVRARAAAKLIRAEYPGLPDFSELAATESKASVLAIGKDGVVRALEGVIVLSRESPILVRKGSTNHAWKLSELEVVAHEPGYHGQNALASRFTAAITRVPRTNKVDLDVIPLTRKGSRSSNPSVAAAFLVDGESNLRDDSYAGCVFLATDRDGDTVHGYLWTPDNIESGGPRVSLTVDELETRGGNISGYTQDRWTMKTAISSLGRSRAIAYAALTSL